MEGELKESQMELMFQKSQILKGISHPIRLCIVRKLCREDSCNVTDFINCMGAGQSNVSQHLRKMRDIGILGSTREGQNVNYYLINEDVKKIIKILFENEGEVDG